MLTAAWEARLATMVANLRKDMVASTLSSARAVPPAASRISGLGLVDLDKHGRNSPSKPKLGAEPVAKEASPATARSGPTEGYAHTALKVDCSEVDLYAEAYGLDATDGATRQTLRRQIGP
jgi:hypothetical protein